MTYCVGIFTAEGLVMASDSRTNAGNDQVYVTRKMHTFARDGERLFVLLTSGSLSLTQSVVTLLRRDFNAGEGLARAGSLYDAARVVGEEVRKVDALDRAGLERDGYTFNVNLLLGGQLHCRNRRIISIFTRRRSATQSSTPWLQAAITRGVRIECDCSMRGSDWLLARCWPLWER